MTVSRFQREFDEFRKKHPEKSVDVDGTQWTYLAGGKGKRTVLVLHGGDSVAEWSHRYVRQLEKFYRVIAPTVPATVTTVKEAVAGLTEILNAEVVGKVNVVGFSLGGMLAQAMLRDNQERVENLVLFTTMPPSKRYAEIFQSRQKKIAGTPKWLIRKVGTNFIAKQFRSARELKGATEHKTIRAALVAEEAGFWGDYFHWVFSTERVTKDSFLATANLQIDYVSNYEFSPEELKDWPGGVLIFEAEQDPLVEEPERAELKALYPEAQVVTVGGSAHVGGLLQPEQFIAAMLDFLADPSRPVGTYTI